MRTEGGEPAFRKQAVDLVLRSPVSKGQLIRKLERRTGDAALVKRTADWLEELGLLDDLQYAREVTRRCAAKGYGVFRAKEELRRRQVPRDFWEEALGTLPDPAPVIDAFLAARLAAGERAPKTMKKAADALARRGFCREDIREGVNRLRVEDEPEF